MTAPAVLAKWRRSAKRYKQAHQAAGLCRYCPRPRAPGDGRYCYLHRVQRRDWQRRTRAAARARRG